MPQLDKYIFFNHIFSLTVFFFLIYIYLRKHVVPDISSILKFRKKKLMYISNILASYETRLGFSKIVFEKNSKQSINLVLNKVNFLILQLSELLGKQFLNLYTTDGSAIKSSKLINNSYFKNQKELNRFVNNYSY